MWASQRERERERESVSMCVCACVRVWGCVYVCVSVCVHVCEMKGKKTASGVREGEKMRDKWSILLSQTSLFWLVIAKGSTTEVIYFFYPIALTAGSQFFS